MIAKRFRFHGHGSLRYVYKHGDVIRRKYLTVKYSKNPRRRHNRYAVVVSKKVHKRAVKRNSIRRRIYEILRTQTPHHSEALDIVIIVTSSEILHAPHSELTALFREISHESIDPSL